MLNQEKPKEYVLSSNETHSVREMCEYVFTRLGLNYKDYVVQNPKYMRPEELKYLKGDPSKAIQVLGWEPEYTFESMLEEMIERWEKEL